ncbi:MAG: hypothetical protein [Bacteriophage sp.]|nr:MAG: hypothetical protein [Bacteriophage sp.]
MTKKLSTPFAINSTLRNDVPVNATNDQTNKGVVGYNNGWTSINKLPLENGGQPPYMEDMNGLFFDITGNIVDINKGLPQYYDDAYATLIGGYPVGARLVLDDNSTTVISTIANNQNNPNTNMSGWVTFSDLEVKPQIKKVNSLSDLLSLTPSNLDVSKVLYRTDSTTTYFSGDFVYLSASTATSDGGTIFSPSSGNGRWFRLYDGDVKALWFGVPDGNTDQNIINSAIQCAINSTKTIDLEGSTWGISGEIAIHKALKIKSTIASKIIVHSGTYTNGYAFEVGDPAQGWSGDRTTLIQEGMLWMETSTRDFKLHGLYMKGSFNSVQSVRTVGFNGKGIHLESFYDSQVGRFSVELCGNETDYAFTCTSADDTSNTFSIDSLQVEQSYQRGIYMTNTIRSTINNIHSERLIVTNKNTTNDNPLGYDLNHVINIGNCTINQAIFDATDNDIYARIDGPLCTYTNFFVNSGNVYGSFGDDTTYINLFAKSFLQYGTYKDISFIEPDVQTMTLTDTVTLENPIVTDMIFGYQAKNINTFGGSITNYGGSTTSDVAMGNINAFGTNITNVYKTGNGSGYSSSLTSCHIANFYGNWDNIIKVTGGDIATASLSTRSMAIFDNVTFGDFSANGDLKYITRNCTATGSVAWSVPTALTTQLGTLTERIGYSVDGKIYQYDGKSWSKLV